MSVIVARLAAIAAILALPGCLTPQAGSLEILNPKQSYGKSLAVIADFHNESRAIEARLASDLKAALAKRGLAVIDDPAKADLVVLPTLGRMREKTAVPSAPIEVAISAAGDAPLESAEPVVAAPAPEARPFTRFSGANPLTRADLASRRAAVPSARVPPNAQQAGLLLSAYLAADFMDYGIGRQSLPPVWRIYVSQPVSQLKWNSVARPLVDAAAAAAAPLSASTERRAGGTGGTTNSAGQKVEGEQFAGAAAR